MGRVQQKQKLATARGSAKQFRHHAAKSWQHFLVLEHVVLAERAEEAVGGEGDDFAAAGTNVPDERAVRMKTLVVEPQPWVAFDVTNMLYCPHGLEHPLPHGGG